jgi:RNA polymerase sigma-B factor
MQRPQEDRLLRRFAATRDPELRRRIVERYLPLARFAALRYANGPEPFDDLLQVASLGLLKALDRYDPENGAAFTSFALPTIEGELRRHFRDRSWAVRPPRRLQEDALLVARVTTELEARHQHAPTVDDVARRARLTTTEVLAAREALGARRAVSLVTHAGPDGELSEAARRHGAVDPGYARVDDRVTLDALAAETLTPREREILRLRFGEDLTQAQIGVIVGLSQMHVSRTLRGCEKKLRGAALAAA